MIDWGSVGGLLPAYAAYEKKSIDRVFQNLNIVAGSDTAKVLAFQYPFNISEAGEVSEARPFTVEQQSTWIKQYTSGHIEKQLADEAAKIATLETSSLWPLQSVEQPRSTNATEKAQGSQSSACVPSRGHRSPGISKTYPGVKSPSGSPPRSHRASVQSIKQCLQALQQQEKERQQHRDESVTAPPRTKRSVIPVQLNTGISRPSKVVQRKQSTATQTRARVSPSYQGSSIPIKPIPRGRDTQTVASAETAPDKQDQTRPVIVIVGFQDPSTADTRAAMQQAMDILSQTMNGMQGSAGTDSPSVVVSNSSMSTQAQQDASVSKGLDAPIETNAALSQQ